MIGEGVGAARLDRTIATPLWNQLYDDLVRRLESGELLDDFPGEIELIAEYGVSRNTVREAVRRLRMEGVVSAGRGRRPTITRVTKLDSPLGALFTRFASMRAAGVRQESVVRVLERRVEPSAALRLGRRSTTPLIYLERLRLANNEPFALDRLWFSAKIAEPLLDADFTESGFYQELTRRTGVQLTEGSEEIHAVIPTPFEREALGINGDVAAFLIERLGSVEGNPVEWRQTTVRGDRFGFIGTFSGRRGYEFNVRNFREDSDQTD